MVLIYNATEVTTVPLSVRADWIRTLYPKAEVIEAWDGPTIIGNSPEIRQLHEDYLHKILGEWKITHFYSSEFYGEHVSQALGAKDCRIDPDRTRIPISGSALRANLFENRQFLDPLVYRDLVTWVTFVGAPSTGKTTLCKHLADQFDTTWAPEYGREYWEKHQINRRLSLEQLLEIAQRHRAREEEWVRDARDYLFVDTDATTTRHFSLYYHGEALPELDRLADDAARRYDLVFLCEDDIPYDDTWDRSGETNRAEFQERIRADLARRGTPFVSLSGSLAERTATVRSVLSKFDKWTPSANPVASLQ